MYKSTRSEIDVTPSKAIIDGISSDGGLYIKDIKKIYDDNSLLKLKSLSYKELTLEILKGFLNFSDDRLKQIIDKSYDFKFDTKELVNIKSFGNLSFLELYHGPSLAFKDMALSILPNLLVESKKIENENYDNIILTATSGDTGSAALSGFSNVEGVKMIVLYPKYGVSKLQEMQMQSFNSKDKRVIGINGNFDDAQSLVKKAFNDEKNKNYHLSSANSINIGRLIPQIVYYFYAYFKVAKDNEEISFVVPTGNFGDILAGYIAKMMGLPVKNLVCASNDNKVLTDFFETKVYDKRREFLKTISPSMDILISSNLERLLYYITKDTQKVKKYMNDLQTLGYYKVDEEISSFKAGYASVEETKKAINKVYQEYKYLIDPHTAVAYSVYEKLKMEEKTVILSTAHPYKFPLAVCESLNINCENEFDGINKLIEKTKVAMPEKFNKLKETVVRDIWEKDEAYEKLCKLIKELNNV